MQENFVSHMRLGMADTCPLRCLQRAAPEVPLCMLDWRNVGNETHARQSARGCGQGPLDWKSVTIKDGAIKCHFPPYEFIIQRRDVFG